MAQFKQQLLQPLIQNSLAISRNDIDSDRTARDMLVAFKLDDIENLTEDQLRQQYQSRFSIEEFHRLIIQNYEMFTLLRFPSHDLLIECLTQNFRRAVGLYVDDDFNGELPPFTLGHYGEFTSFRYCSDQFYTVLGDSEVTLTLVNKHRPTIFVADNSIVHLNTANAGDVEVHLLDNATLNVKSGNAPLIIIKEGESVTINDETGKATIIEDPRSLSLIPLSISGFRRFVNAIQGADTVPIV